MENSIEELLTIEEFNKNYFKSNLFGITSSTFN